MNFQSILLLWPCIAGFFWYGALLLFAPKGAAFNKSRRFIGILSFFFLFTSLSFNQESRLLLHYTLFEQVCALMLIPSFLSYIHELKGIKTISLIYKIFWAIPFVHLLIGIESVYSAGFENSLSILISSYTFNGPMFPYLDDNSHMVFYACYTYMFRTCLLLAFMLFSVNVMSCMISKNCSPREIFNFLFKGHKTKVVAVQFFFAMLQFLIVVCALVLGKNWYSSNPVIDLIGCVLSTIFVLFMGFVATAGDAERKSLPGIYRMVRFGEQDDGSAVSSVENADFSDGNIKSGSEKAHIPFVQEPVGINKNEYSKSDEVNTFRSILDSSFEKLVLGEELFLKRDVSLQKVADALEVMRDELSEYIESTYGMSFSSYINMLRIDYAEQFILNHDDVTQKEIAACCGFSSASSFNTAFTRMTGVTPKIWKDRYVEMSKKG